MTSTVVCPQCGAKLRVPESYARPRVKCSKCKTGFDLPGRSFPVAIQAPVRPVVEIIEPARLPPAVTHLSFPVPALIREEKPCPFCGEEVLAVAKKCKHCGETLDVALRAVEQRRQQAPPPAAPVFITSEIRSESHAHSTVIFKERGKTFSCCGCLMLALLVGGGAFLALGVIGHSIVPTTKMPTAKMTNFTLSVGSICVLTSTDPILIVGQTKEALKEYMSLDGPDGANPANDAAMDVMLKQKRVFFVDSGSQATLLEHGEASSRVRFRDGKFAGQEAWVLDKHLAKN